MCSVAGQGLGPTLLDQQNYQWPRSAKMEIQTLAVRKFVAAQLSELERIVLEDNCVGTGSAAAAFALLLCKG